MLAAGKARGAGGVGGAPLEYVGGDAKAVNTLASPNTQAWADSFWNISAVASPGDLVVLFGTHEESTAASFPNTSFTRINSRDVSGIIGDALYRFWEAGDANPYFAWSSFSYNQTWAFAVFRGVNSYLGVASGANSLNPPSLTQNGKLWLTSAHGYDGSDDITGPPTGYTQPFSMSPGESNVHCTVAYKIEELSSDDPATWPATGSYQIIGTKTIAFD